MKSSQKKDKKKIKKKIKPNIIIFFMGSIILSPNFTNPFIADNLSKKEKNNLTINLKNKFRIFFPSFFFF